MRTARRTGSASIVVFAALAQAVLGGCGGDNDAASSVAGSTRPASDAFWQQVAPAFATMSGEYLFTSLSSLLPGADDIGVRGEPIDPATVVIEGTITALGPGKAFGASGDALYSTEVPYDDPAAEFRWFIATVRIDKVLAGELADQEVRVELPQPAGVTLETLRESLPISRTVFFLDRALDMLASPAGEVDTEYYSRVYRPVGNAVFTETAGRLKAPLWDESTATAMLRGLEDLANLEQAIQQPEGAL